MRPAITITAAILAVTLSCAGRAATVPFTGSLTAIAHVAPNLACAPQPLQGVITGGSGLSNFGAFAYSHVVCLSGGIGPVAGTFLADFGIDQFHGTLSGEAAAGDVGGTFDQTFKYILTGGTGRFLGATGGFNGGGLVDARNPPPKINFTFDGQINAPGVPEPAAWSMMLIGFGSVGSILRARRQIATRRPRSA